MFVLLQITDCKDIDFYEFVLVAPNNHLNCWLKRSL